MSLPFTPREVKATEARLRRIYNGAQLGLKGDRLAVFAGMLPVEYKQLKQLDPVVELAELKGRTDAEVEAATTLRNSSLSGDAKSALAILQHQHEWTSKQDSVGGGITVVVQRGLTAEVEGGVLRISENANKGNPVSEIPAIEGELVG